jgi:hypothetical protein
MIAPVVRLVLSGPIGWRYTGTDDERRRLVRHQPLVAFGPVDPATGNAASGRPAT